MKEWLNLDQSPLELEDLYGDKDYYWYLRSSQFREAFHRPLAEILDHMVDSVLDVGCGEAVLSDYFNGHYVGIEGSVSAVRRFAERTKAVLRPPLVLLGRMENPSQVLRGSFQAVVFGGVLEVLVKPKCRVPFMDMYVRLYSPRYLFVLDLERLDEVEIERRYGKPVIKGSWTSPELDRPLEEVKRHRKVLVYSTAKSEIVLDLEQIT